jgi:NADP-dependent 3-hydroxy acid dehydrogenase YdfG
MTAGRLDGQAGSDVHVVTGATSGIGRAIAIVLAQRGHRVLAIGRNRSELDGLETQSQGRIIGRAIDMLDDQALDSVAQELTLPDSRIGALVHCAGVYMNSALATTPVAELDRMFRSNVRAPFLLTQLLLGPLERASGYLVVINSSAGISENIGTGAGAHAALQHANRVMADVWRQELNSRGIRVLSIYPGRTNTPRIERLFAQEGRKYSPELLLQPEDIAEFVALAVGLRSTVELTDIKIRPARKSY